MGNFDTFSLTITSTGINRSFIEGIFPEILKIPCKLTVRDVTVIKFSSVLVVLKT